MTLLIVSQRFLHSSLRIEMSLFVVSQREEVAGDHSALQTGINGLLYSDVLQQLLLLSISGECREVLLLFRHHQSLKHYELSWAYSLTQFYCYILINIFHNSGEFGSPSQNISGIFL